MAPKRSYRIVIDIGNSSTSVGLSTSGRIVSHRDISTSKVSRTSLFASLRQLLKLQKIKMNRVEATVVSSVVPQKTFLVKRSCARLIKKPIFCVGTDVRVPIHNRYKKPKQVGADRLVGAYAALRQYGPGVIIVDFGTAITFDVVSRKREYLGGLILPGISLSLQSLAQRTALLPFIAIRKPRGLIGTDTQASINQGIVFGMAGACDTILARLLLRYRGYRVVATGGDAQFIQPWCRCIKRVRKHLVLEGLSLLPISS